MNEPTLNAVQSSRMGLLTDPERMKSHVEVMDSEMKLVMADSAKEHLLMYQELVRQSMDPEVHRKYVMFVAGHLGIGESARKADNGNDKLPTFHFHIDKGEVRMETIDALTQEVLDTFDLSTLKATPQMRSALSVNDDITDLEAD